MKIKACDFWLNAASNKSLSDLGNYIEVGKKSLKFIKHRNSSLTFVCRAKSNLINALYMLKRQ
jgi:hypothetical protein